MLDGWVMGASLTVMIIRAPAVLKSESFILNITLPVGYLCFHFLGRDFQHFLAHQKYQCIVFGKITAVFGLRQLN